MGRHRGSGEGSIFKSGDLWRGQLTLNGKRKSVSGKTKKEVADKLAKLRTEYNTGNYVERNDITVEEWVNYWLEHKVKPKLSEQSYLHLEGLFRNHLIREIGNIRLQDLTRPLLEETYANVFRRKGTDKMYQQTDYSHSTVNALSVQMKKCLQFAVDSDILGKNPHNGVELHKLRPPKKISAHTNADQEKIIDYCKYGKQFERVYYFLISTGMRFGEAVALTWDDVDLKTGKISINKTAVSIHGNMEIQDRTKTATGMRTIYVGENITEWLKWHKSQLDSEANYRNLIFPNTRYNITNQANAIAAWKKICEQLGVRYQGIHALRHTWATRALEAGLDVKVVSQMLGHKNVITTMNIYQDVLDAEKIKAARTLNAQY